MYSLYTICPRSSALLYTINHYIKWVTTSLTYSNTPVFLVWNQDMEILFGLLCKNKFNERKNVVFLGKAELNLIVLHHPKVLFVHPFFYIRANVSFFSLSVCVRAAIENIFFTHNTVTCHSEYCISIFNFKEKVLHLRS